GCKCDNEIGMYRRRWFSEDVRQSKIWLLMEGQADGIYNIAVYHCIKILVEEPVAIP
ncbi:hypothetical protein Tco_0646126, partial [Tanacetum coccineum]